MISLALAQQLKDSGLRWEIKNNDYFAIPDRGLDDSIFVISNMTVLVEVLSGRLAVTFHGAVEWALDHVEVTELIWLPREEQLREMVEQQLIGQPEPTLVLISTVDGYRCEIQFQGQTLTFDAFGASDAYGKALLHIIQQRQTTA